MVLPLELDLPFSVGRVRLVRPTPVDVSELAGRYRFSDNWEVFGEWANITNEPFKVFFKTPNGGVERLGQPGPPDLPEGGVAGHLGLDLGGGGGDDAGVGAPALLPGRDVQHDARRVPGAQREP